MGPYRRLPFACFALVFLALAACSSAPAASPPVSGVAVFVNPSYVDYVDPAGLATTDIGHEGDNVLATLRGAGLAVTTFTGLTGPEVRAALSRNAAAVIPEMEVNTTTPTFDADAIQALYEFVNGGGNLAVCSWYGGPGVVAAVFGVSLTSVGTSGTISLQAAASGTPFAGGAATLSPNDATISLSTTNVPPTAKVVYADGAGNPVVLVVPFGAGNIVFFGWDWFDGAPWGSQDGGWLDVLETAVRL